MSLILVADDDRNIRDMLKHSLTLHGFKVIEASNGIEAVELCSKFSPSIILIDIEMPLLDGIEATRRITQMNSGTVVIGITGHSNRKYELLQAGAREVIIKPFSGKMLIDTIRKYLGGGGEFVDA
jgi:DNA-binding response OmpR family regulator